MENGENRGHGVLSLIFRYLKIGAGPAFLFFNLLSLSAADCREAPKTMMTSVGSEMVLIEGGSYYRGSEDGREDEGPRREIKVSSFYMGKHPVTQREYERLMADNPSNRRGNDNPVDSVRWIDAITFCNRLSRREGLRPVYCTETFIADFRADGYRLPTEAEWEYAARAGTETRFFWGNSEGKLRHFAWFGANSQGRTRPVAMKHASPLGLYDIYGNVWEWCHDYYDADYYARSPVKNPRGPEDGEQRVLRGGSWDTRAAQISSSYRYSEDPGYYDICFGYDIYGFRLVRNAE